jgi:predicted transcriptional regulator
LEAVRDNEPAATSEVAEQVCVTRQGADYRLRRLKEQGKVRKKKAGNSLIWFLVEENREGENDE